MHSRRIKRQISLLLHVYHRRFGQSVLGAFWRQETGFSVMSHHRETIQLKHSWSDSVVQLRQVVEPDQMSFDFQESGSLGNVQASP